MSRYVYDGYLQQSTVDQIESMAREYGQVLEISSLPSNWVEWYRANLTDYPDTVEDCMGQSHPRMTKSYGYVRRSAEKIYPGFLFFKSKEEMLRFVKSFPQLVTNTNPFTTIIWTGQKLNG